MRILFLLLIIWNIIVGLIYGIDKLKAIKKKRRIRESTLLLLGFCFGGVGALFSMILFNHKTVKMKFRLTIPFFVILQLFVFRIYLCGIFRL